MTDYTKSTNFATKDTLPPGSALKIVRGTELDTEFNAIATAVATKADLASPAFTGTPTAPTATAGDNDTSIATTAFVSTAVSTAVATAVNNVGYPAFKNRIINGAMVINQRAGGTVTVNQYFNYITDRWCAFANVNGKYISAQSSTAPTGFTNSLVATSLFAYTVGANEVFNIGQYIEGYNTADLGWGTASAKTVTLSFWVQSSLTGTFGGAFRNSAEDRSYPFTYTISSANTWEYKTVTVVGDTSGTWLTTNGIGIRVVLGLGVGSTYSGTAGAWASANYYSATGATSVVGTNGATFYITGVQLEKGSTATSFDYRPYGTELQLCQRYLPAFNSSGTISAIGAGQALSTTSAIVLCAFPVPTRVAPTGISISSLSHISSRQPSGGFVTYSSSATLGNVSTTVGEVVLSGGSGGTAAGGSSMGYFNNASGQILFTGCEL